jgi:putative tryptophan/tyrosine transport system ATP-binding protein
MLTLQGIRRSFDTGSGERVAALRDVGLEVAEGEFLLLVGTNGSGKSTLLNVIAGSERMERGSIFLNGMDISGKPVHRRSAYIGRVFQDPSRGTIPDLTVEENLALAARRHERIGLRRILDRKFSRQCHDKLASLGIGLETRLRQRVSTLSGGQRQILTLLMATWRKPLLLLLDEHTAALDPKSADIVLLMTQRIIREENISAIMVTHSMRHASRIGDRLCVMHRGSIVRDIRGTEKRRLSARELLDEFETLRRNDLMDESVAALLREQYV